MLNAECKMLNILAAGIVSLAVILGLAGCSADKAAEVVVITMDDGYAAAKEIDAEDAAYGMYATAEDRLAAMTKVAEDGKSELWFDESYLEIGVRDKASGLIWFSAPYDYKKDAKASAEVKASIASILRLNFYDAAQNEKKMTSYTDCAAKGQFGWKINGNGNGIVVQMLVGRVEEKLLVPYAAEKENFEEKVLNKIENARELRRLKSYYTLYSWGDETMSRAVRDNLQEYYPGIVDHDLYILRGSNDREKKQLEALIKQTDYTQEDLDRDNEISGFVAEAESQALFKITIEFKLEDGCLVVNLPADKIEYDGASFILGKIQLLEYFGAGKSANDGYMFIPDGSGALIHFNKNANKPVPTVIKPVYGEDSSLKWYDWHDNINEAARFPVFGIKELSGAFFAVIEEGDAMAEIIAQSGNVTNSYESVSASFYYGKSFLATYDDGVKQRGNYRYFDKNYYQGNYAIRYGFLSGSAADYSGMAKFYREYLTGKGALSKLSVTNESAPLFLETLGKLEKRDTFMGIPYNRNINLTTFSESQKIMEELKGAGVENITLRLRGWFNGGLDYTVPSKIKVESALGGKKGLDALTSWAKSQGFAVYPDVDFTIVRRTGLLSGYNNLFDSPKSIDNYPVYSQPKEMVTNMGYIKWDYYTIAPSKTSALFGKFAKAFEKSGLDNISIASAGTTIFADYNRKRPMNLQQSEDVTVSNLAGLAGSAGKILIDGGNAYALEFADKVMNVPLTGSSYVIADENVPFMQLVLHGSVSYSGGAVNKSADTATANLKNAEYGANPSFTVAYANTEEMKDSVYSFYYAVDYETWRQTIIDGYTAFNAAYRGLDGVYMTRHDRLSDGVYKTEYENGVSILVNYTAEDFEYRGNTVGAMSFIRIGG